MIIKPGQAFSAIFTTQDPTSLQAANLDSSPAPAAVVYRNNTVDGTFSLSIVSAGITGVYKVSGTVPATYAAGDSIDIIITAYFNAKLQAAKLGSWKVAAKLIGEDTPGTTTLLTRIPGTAPLASDWTPARAAKLDNLDAPISSRSTYNGVDTSGVTTLLTRITGAIPLASDWTPARAANLDAPISSRSTYNGVDTAGTTTLLSLLTPARADKLDNLDAPISSRSTYAGADTSGTTTLLALLTPARASKLDNLDAPISSRSTYNGEDPAGVTTLLTRVTGAVALAADWTSARADKLDNLDATISSRMATFIYTAPDNESIVAIKARTDNLPDQPAAVGSAMTLAPYQDVRNVYGMVAGMVAPDNEGIAAIRVKTDNLPAQPAAIGSPMTLAPDQDVRNVTGEVAGMVAPDNESIVAIKAKTDNLPEQPAAVGSPMTLEEATVANIRDGLFLASRYVEPDNAKIGEVASTLDSVGAKLDDIESIAWKLDTMIEGEDNYRFTSESLALSPASDGSLTPAQAAMLADIAVHASLITAGNITVSTPVTKVGNRIEARAGDSWVITLDGLGPITSRESLRFAFKRTDKDEDNSSLLMIEETVGLEYYKRRPAADPTRASLLVTDAITGEVQIVVDEELTAELSGDGQWAIKMVTDTATTLAQGPFLVLPAIIRSTSGGVVIE